MGLRVNLSRSRTTSRRGGSNGASVPRPAEKKSHTQRRRTDAPVAIRAPAATAVSEVSGRIDCDDDDRRIRNGTYPATVPGIRKTKRIERNARKVSWGTFTIM